MVGSVVLLKGWGQKRLDCWFFSPSKTAKKNNLGFLCSFAGAPCDNADTLPYDPEVAVAMPSAPNKERSPWEPPATPEAWEIERMDRAEWDTRNPEYLAERHGKIQKRKEEAQKDKNLQQQQQQQEGRGIAMQDVKTETNWNGFHNYANQRPQGHEGAKGPEEQRSQQLEGHKGLVEQKSQQPQAQEGTKGPEEQNNPRSQGHKDAKGLEEQNSQQGQGQEGSAKGLEEQNILKAEAKEKKDQPEATNIPPASARNDSKPKQPAEEDKPSAKQEGETATPAGGVDQTADNTTQRKNEAATQEERSALAEEQSIANKNTPGARTGTEQISQPNPSLGEQSMSLAAGAEDKTGEVPTALPEDESKATKSFATKGRKGKGNKTCEQGNAAEAGRAEKAQKRKRKAKTEKEEDQPQKQEEQQPHKNGGPAKPPQKEHEPVPNLLEMEAGLSKDSLGPKKRGRGLRRHANLQQ